MIGKSEAEAASQPIPNMWAGCALPQLSLAPFHDELRKQSHPQILQAPDCSASADSISENDEARQENIPPSPTFHL